MAYPRVFLSSPLKGGYRDIRNHVEEFIRERHYDCVMFESADIPYGLESSILDDCYEEIKNCDILVSIIGNRFGSESDDPRYSVSQMEVHHARDLGLHLYIFVEKNVFSEFETFRQNPHGNVTFAHVDDPRIFHFLTEISRAKVALFPFESSGDITKCLNKQLAGLMHRTLRSTRQQKLTHITSSKPPQRLLFSSPAAYKFQAVLELPQPKFFEDMAQLSAFLTARGFKRLEDDPWGTAMQWLKSEPGFQSILSISKQLLDGKWEDDFITLKHWEIERRDERE